MITDGYEVSFGEMENVLKLIVMMVEQFYEYTKKKKTTTIELCNLNGKVYELPFFFFWPHHMVCGILVP